MPLTDNTLKSLKPKDKAYIVSDDRGLYIEVLPTGGMAWRYRYRINGRYEKLTLGRYPSLTLKNARIKRDEASSMVAIGQSPAQKKQASKQFQATLVTVASFSERFFNEVQLKDRKNCTMPHRYLINDILPFLGQKFMMDLTVDDVRTVIWNKKNHGFDAAAGQIRSILKRMCDYAMTCGVLTSNPVLALPMRHVHKQVSRERVLSPNEISLFLNAVFESNIRNQFKIALHLILITMVRKSELLLARWEDVHFDVAEWHIPIEHSKTGKPHIVYLSTQAVELFKKLKTLSGASTLVLPGCNSLTKPFSHNTLNKALSSALNGHQIATFTIHDLRRTASTILHENGWGSDIVEKALNHVIGGVRGVYNRAEYADQRREMLQFWANFVENKLI